MEYNVFRSAVQWTEAQWNKRRNGNRGPTYAELKATGNHYWLHLENLDKQGLSKEVIRDFLNTPRWFCHLDDPSSPEGTQMVDNLHGALQQLPALYSSLQGIRIEDIAPGRQEESTLLIASQIYSTFRGIRPKFGPVAASKLMHMALPDLFMMWDNSIIKGYGVAKESLPNMKRECWSYSSFLLLMNENIGHIRETYADGLNLTYEQLFERINKDLGHANLPITRLLDIANFAVGEPHRELEDVRKGKTHLPRGAPDAKCQRCLERTNSRLGRLVRYDHQFKPGRYRP